MRVGYNFIIKRFDNRSNYRNRDIRRQLALAVSAVSVTISPISVL